MKKLITLVLALAAVSSFAKAPSDSAGTLAAAVQHAHTRLLVKNFDANFAFYKDVLGFKVSYLNKGIYADMETGEMTIAIFARAIMSADTGTRKKRDAADAQDHVALIFTVKDVDAMVERLKSKGVAFVTEPHDRKDWGIRVAHFRDPDGNLLEVNGALKGIRG